MVSVINNGFDLEKKEETCASQSEKGSRVLNAEHEHLANMNDDINCKDNNRDGNLSDLHLNEKIRVSSGQDIGAQERELVKSRVLSEMDEFRVSDRGFCAKGESEDLSKVDGVRVSEKNEGDGECEVKVKEMEDRVVEDVVIRSDSEMKDKEIKGGVGPVGEKVRRRALRRNEGSKMEGKVSDVRSETHGSVQDSVNKDVSATNVDDEVGIESVKILGSSFEMGDMVWGKVKSHPWWPGHLFNEAFATSSVRRTRRHGHVLVAFFGDSSYGWFDPAELVPYDPHYAEKAEQTTSKNFVRAVEESVDEISRRSALGLSCRCRNVTNFRPVNVPGYLAVDVVDYDPGSIYSLSQIRKARDNFRPFNTLSFIKQLAVAPMSSESKNLDFIKNKAATLAYRRSIFEEYDETYAEAFNQQPARAPHGLPDKEPYRAPLSGPLVIADTLGGQKSSSKPTKTKQSKKDRYLFKRRDQAGDARTTETTQGHASSSSSAYEDGTSDTTPVAYVLQKRELDVSDESAGASSTKDQVATSAHAGPTKDAPITGIGVMVPFGSQVMSSPMLTVDLGNLPEKAPEGDSGMKDGMMKTKAVKRPLGKQSFEKSNRPEKQMKKMKKKDGQKSMEHGERDSVLSGGVVKSARMPMEIGASFREDSQGSQLRKDNEPANSGTRGSEPELLQMLADLRGLALNPVHGTERNGPTFTRQFFLKFRSLVYLKSSSASAPAESESVEARAIKVAPGSEPSEKLSTEGGRVVSSLKVQKVSAKHEDPSKGRKRIPSERQEENAAKRAKKITEVKSLSSEKRAVLKNPELQQRTEGKPKTGAALNLQSKSMIKSEQREKKIPRVEEPTYLIMKFQAGSSLPSIMELKARFARFGPLDISLSRVFYTTNTCRVAFLYKQDANVACRSAMANKSVFSNVKFLLKPVAAPEPQQPSSGKVEDVQSENAGNCNSPAQESKLVNPTPIAHQVTPQLKSCLKKPSGNDETGGTNNGGSNARTARVRFNMGEVKSGSTDNRGGLQGPKMESNNSMLSNEGLSSSSSMSVAMDISNNNQRLTVSSHPSQPPLLPLPQFVRAPINPQSHHLMVELSPRNNVHDNCPKINLPLPLPESQARAPPTIDISQQMMSLLTKCHDVVTNVKSVLGYIPYHPL